MEIFAFRFQLATLLLGLTFCGGAASSGEGPDCRRLLDGSRGTLDLTSEKISSTVEGVWTDRLIRELEIEHLQAFAARTGGGPITWRAFSPTWVIQSPDTLGRAVEYFDPSDDSTPEYAGTVHEWLESWEKGYQAHIGPIAPSWQQKNRRRFIQALLVEGAVHYSIREGFSTPEAFLAVLHERFPSYSPMGTGIEVAFSGDVSRFQHAFDKAFRQHGGIRLGSSSATVPPHETKVRADLRRVGVKVEAVRDWQPVIAASYRERTGDQDVQLVVESVQASGNPSTGLFALLQESTNLSEGNEQTGFGTAALNAALERAGGVKPFFERVNQALAKAELPRIGPSQGATTLSEELVVQLAHYSWVSVHGTAAFAGFQAMEAQDPVYFDMGSELVRRSGLTMAEINQLVTRRLQAP